MLDKRDIKKFENKLMRLVYAPIPNHWVGLLDDKGNEVLVCQCVPINKIDFMKAKYGYDINPLLPERKTKNIVIVLDKVEKTLLNVFPSGGSFEPTMIDNLEHYYSISSEIELRGMGSIFRIKILIWIFWLVFMFALGVFLSKIF